QPHEITKTLQFHFITEVHDTKDDHTVVVGFSSGSPYSLKRKLTLNGCDATEAEQQLVLECHVLSFRDGVAVVVVEREKDLDASNRPCHGGVSPRDGASVERPRS